MAIANTILKETKMGDMTVVHGKSVITGTTDTGDAATGLTKVYMMHLNVAGSAQKGCSINETFPLNSGDVTIVKETNDGTCYWTAYGLK